jgi:N-hydroxyarylamine O-acetyltransferase
MLDVGAYLRRIHASEPAAPTASALADLQLAHLLHVPFENLHVWFRRGVDVDLAWSVPKIVDRRQGGWCFELNGAFGALLSALGYDVTMLSCRTHVAATGGSSPDFDHLALVVVADGDRYLVDVGWGDNAMSPIPLEPGEHDVRPRTARIELERGVVRLVELVERVDGAVVWEPQYEADLRPRALADFRARSTFLQTDPSSIFTAKPLVTQARSALGARTTLHRDRLTTRTDDGRISTTAVHEDDWTATLLDVFGLDPP